MYTSLPTSAHLFKDIFLKTFTVLMILSCVLSQQMFGQVVDDFSDGDFTSNPVWTGDGPKFTVSTGALKLNAPAATSQAYLSTPSLSIDHASWEFYVKMDQSPTTGNYAKVYLVSDHADLSGSLNGYYVGIGNALDEVGLYRQTGMSSIKIINGTDATLGASPMEARIKVTRDDLGNWELFRDVGLTSTYTSEGAFPDNTHLSSSYFGILCVYTSMRSDEIYFDDFVVAGIPFVDTKPPELQEVTVLSASDLNLSFSEEIEPVSAKNVLNYNVPGLGNPSLATLQAGDKNVTISFSESFANGIESTIDVVMVADTAGNAIDLASKSFLFFQPSPVSYRDIVISEIFADPSPPTGLPEKEFIEVFNRSPNPIDLLNWKITDGGTPRILPSKIVLPGEYIILTDPSSMTLFQAFGTTLPVTNIPALNNTGDALKLIDNNDQPVDSVHYSDDWYGDDDKKQGGWTLELIDPENVCKGEENWTASTH